MGKRLFVSIDLDGLAEAVATVQELFDGVPGLNHTDPEQAHVTLKFLGDTPDHRIEEVREGLEAAVAAAETGSFEAEFGGLGIFPSLDYISVIWIGVRTGSEQMTRLHEAIEPRMVDLGFDPEDHDFTPHATIARMDHAGGKETVQETVRERDPDVGTTQVESIRLTESVLGPDGPRYSTLEQIDL